MYSIQCALQLVLCEEVSLHFSSCPRATVEQSVDYFFEDIEDACFNNDEATVAPCTIVWIPKKFVGCPVFPTLARATWEHVDASVDLLLVQILPIDNLTVMDCHDMDAMCAVLKQYIRTTTISCCDAQSFVKDRIPLTHSESILFSKKCKNPSLDLMGKVMRFIRDDAAEDSSFGALREDVLNSVKLSIVELDQIPLCPEEAARVPIESLCDNILEKSVYIADCTNVCSWAALMANHKALQSPDGVFEQTTIQLETRLVKTVNLLCILGSLSQVVKHVSSESIEEWGASWRYCLHEAGSIMSIYASFVTVEILSMIISSFSYMMTKPLRTLIPDFSGVMRHGSGAVIHLHEASHAARQLESLKGELQALFVRGKYSDEEQEGLLQGSTSVINFMQFRIQAICDILRYKDTYSYLKQFKKSVLGMEDTLGEFADVLGQATKHAGHVLDNDCVVEVDTHLQETIILLHRVHLKAFENMHRHILSTSSRKRAEFIAAGCIRDHSDLNTKKVIQCIGVALSQKAEVELDMVNSEFESRKRTIILKGMPKCASGLTWLGFLNAKIAQARSLLSEKEAKYDIIRRSISDQYQQWLEAGLDKIHDDLQHLQAPVLTVRQNTSAVNLHKSFWQSLAELYMVHQFDLIEQNKEMPNILSIYSDTMAAFHKLRHLVCRSSFLFGEVQAIFKPIGVKLQDQITANVHTDSKSITWASALLPAFLQHFEVQVEMLESILQIMRENNSAIDLLGTSLVKSLQFENLMTKCDGLGLKAAFELVSNTMTVSISTFNSRSERAIESCMEKLTDVMLDCTFELDESAIDGYYQALRRRASLICAESHLNVIEEYIKEILKIDDGDALRTHRKRSGIVLETAGRVNQPPELILENISRSVKHLIDSIIELLHDTSVNQMDRARQLNSSLADSLKHVEVHLRSIVGDNVAHKGTCSIEIDCKVSYVQLCAILAQSENGMEPQINEMPIPLTNRLIVVGSTPKLSDKTFCIYMAQEELQKRFTFLQVQISQAKEECRSLLATVQESLAPPIERLCLEDGFQQLVSDLRGKSLSLESTTFNIRQEIFELERAGIDVQHTLHDIDTLAHDSSQAKRSVTVLHRRITESGDQILGRIESLRGELHSIQAEIEWINNIEKIPEAHILDVIDEGALERTKMLVKRGTELLSNLKCLSCLFGLPRECAEPLESAPRLLDILIEISVPFVNWKRKVEDIKSQSWGQYKERIACDLEMVASAEQHVKKLLTVAGHWILYREYDEAIQSISATLHLMSSIMSNALESRHWAKLGGILGEELATEHSLMVSHIWTGNVLEQKAQIEDLVSLVSRESKMRLRLDSIMEQWQAAELELVDYKSKGPIFLNPAGTSDLMEKLEDSIMTLSTMSINRASIHIKDEIKFFNKLLSNVEESMQLWLSTQSVWAYMEAVFDEGDIASQLPDEAARFSLINTTYLQLIENSSENLLVIHLFNGDGMREQFLGLLHELEICQNSLSTYLETKRKAFPRFYFVSDATLLEILSKGSDPREVQKHFQSGLFDGVDHVKFQSDKINIITHLVSKEGEELKLKRTVHVTGPAEEWLTDLVDAMRETLRQEARAAAKEVNKQPIQEFLFNRPAQMALLGLQVKWTADVQQALVQASMGRKGTLKKLLIEYESILSELVNLTISSELSKRDRTSLETCITVFIHQKDTIEDLLEKRVHDPKSFDWLKHGRFRWREDKNTLVVQICDNEFEYGYEYLGVKERLVMTPLTDVCYVALTQAIGMNFGGAPAGPAGTGKTETTKDLGAALGRYVVVFNCSDQMDHHMMGRIFKGLAQAGFWGCFDEFNRINLDVLSVCAQQLNCVMAALRERKQTFTFTDGDTVALNSDVGYFITMNPGYAGRQELPENLKALFRGVTMMAPDRRTIMKVKLAAAGFQESDVISKKFDTLYKLCEQQLTKQPHYDFGLRNILSVLRSAGSAKRANPKMTETTLIMKTLYEMNVSKFVPEDVDTFSGLLDDVFPARNEKAHSNEEFLDTLQKICRDEGKIPHSSWIDKCVQLYETSLVRHGLMVVGPARTGKTAAIDMVAKTLTRLGSKTSIWRMNPKAITAPQMFGKLDQSTGDWTDGIFSALWKKASNASHSVWIVVDGPIDAVWIENLNTVLDDNKLLTLANGDRIRMLPSMRLVFEAENLNNASPATVSRVGVIYMSPSVLGWEPVLQTCIDNAELPLEKAGAYIKKLVNYSIKTFEKCDVKSDVGLIELVEAFLTYLKGYSVSSSKFQESVRWYEEGSPAQAVVDNTVLFCAFWGIAGVLDDARKIIFSHHLKSQLECQLKFLAEGESIHEYFYNLESNCWTKWKTDVPQIDATSFARIREGSIDILTATVPTVQGIRCKLLFDLIVAAGGTPHVIGPRCCGKTTVIRQYCRMERDQNIPAQFLTFSALTSPEICQYSLESYLEKRQGRTYGPIGGKRSIFALDEISLPDTNDWGDQPTNEFVRQLLEMGGFYRLEKPIGEFKIVTDVRYITSSSVEGGLKIPNRLSGKLCSIYMDQPREEELRLMLYSVVDLAVLSKNWDQSKQNLIKTLVNKTVSICYDTASKFRKSSEKFHYTFGMHEACTIVRHALFWAIGRENLNDLVSLWYHECRRELMDKLIAKEDWAVFNSSFQSLNDELISTALEDSFYSNMLSNEDLCPQQYLKIPGGMSAARKNIERVYGKSRSSGHPLVLFDDAVAHVIKISRVLTLPTRSMMLVGVGGSGRKSLTTIASQITDFKCFYPSKGHDDSLTKFTEDLRVAFRESGTKGRNMAFIISDTDIKDEKFLDYINQQLVTGRIAGLFEKEDVDTIVADLRPTFKENMPDRQDTTEEILSYFWERVERQVHFIFCFSPTGDQLFKWTKKFPGLLSACTVNWFHSWPVQALESVSNKLLSLNNEDASSQDKDSVDISALVSKIHFLMTELSETYSKETGRVVHITPKSYLSFIGTVNDLFFKKYKSLRDSYNALNLGMEKMNSAKEQVDRMKDDLKVKQATIAESQDKMSMLMQEIDESTQEATVERKKVQEIVSRVTNQASEIFKAKMEAEQDLEAAKPALDAALDALNSITPKDMNALKALRKPPDVIKRIMDCVLLLRHLPISRPCWHEVKNIMVLQATYGESLKMMNDMGFLQQLLNFPRDEINDETVELLQPYFKSTDFNYSSAKKASGNVAGLCNWAESMCRYHIVAREVQPKIIRLKESEKELQIAKREEVRATSDLDAVESSLNSLRLKFEDADRKMTTLKDDAEKTTIKMNNALTLIESLGGEERRWCKSHRDKQTEMKYLLGDCLLACAFTSYLAPIGVSHRSEFIQRVKELCHREGAESSPDFCPIEFLTDSGLVLKWTEEGLPSDDFSIQNGTLFDFSRRVPYLIDPQGQAMRWLQQKYHNAICIPLSSNAFQKTLEDCISHGRPIVIQNVDYHIGSVLDDVLEPSTEGYVKLGDKEIEVVTGFRAILTTTLPNPFIYPEIFAKCTVINFTVSFNGLADQFLGFLISRDEASLESKRQNLDDDVRKCKTKMQQLESDLLIRLSSYEGDILEDSDLIGVLADTKETTTRVSSRLQEASQTKAQISSTCDIYKPCAKRATLLYFTVCDFSVLNHMYNTSLEQFKVWFDDAIKSAATSEDIQARVQNVTEELTRTIYEKMQYGIFERDKVPFRFLLASRICESDGMQETSLKVNSLLSLGKATSTNKRKPKEWLTNAQWRNALHLQRNVPQVFGELLSSLNSNDAKWKAWLNSEAPEKTPNPFTAKRKLDGLSQICMIRAFRPDRSGIVVSTFVENVLGEQFLSSRTADVYNAASSTKWNCPIICVISPGVDPTSKINEVSRKMKTICHNVSMGQGQEPIARQCVNIAKQRGEWVCIQNAHLAGSYLKELEEELYSMKHADTNFRIWITTEPSTSFPIGLLHMGLRITCEAPSGLRDGLTSLLSALDSDVLDEVKMPQWKSLLISLNVMHVLAQERKKFGPFGWNVPYEFSNADLISSMNVIANHLQDLRGKNSASINWESLHYLIGVIQYGGRIIDERDQNLMMSYCKRFISEDVISGSIMLLNPKRYPKLAPVYRFDVTQEATLEKLIESARQIPPSDIPQIFGLDMSAEVRSKVLEATSMFDSISIAANPPVIAANISTGDGSLMETISSIMVKIQPTPTNIMSDGDNECKLSAPLKSFFKIEIMFLNSVWERATRDLQRLQSIIEGSTTASPEEVTLLEKIKRKEASATWSPQYWWRQDSLDSWVQSYVFCREHIASIGQKCKGRCVWLPGLCNPKALLNAVLQEEARLSKEKGVTIDALQVLYTVTKYFDPKSIRDAPKEGIYLYGCVLEGASWDSQSSKLVNTGDTVPRTFPVIHIKAVPRTSVLKKKNAMWTPLYTSERRTAKAFVDYIPLPIDGSELEWSQGGVALICNE